MTEMTIADRDCLILGNDRPKCILIWFVNADAQKEVEFVAQQLMAERNLPPFLLTACLVNDWNDELSPWRADGIKNQVFSGHGQLTLDWLRDKCIPYLRERWGTDDTAMMVGGYSLAGLFSLWAFHELGIFRGVASCSGSLWYPGWMEYACGHAAPSGSRVYLSLGSREEKARNPVLAQVGEATRASYARYSSDSRVTISVLEWNSGNHFAEPERRMLKGFAWLLRQTD